MQTLTSPATQARASFSELPGMQTHSRASFSELPGMQTHSRASFSELPGMQTHSRATFSLGPLTIDCRSLTAALLAGIALLGRILMLATAGPATAIQLIAVLLIGASACAVGTHAAAGDASRGFSRLLARVGQRAGAVQVLLSLVSLALLV